MKKDETKTILLSIIAKKFTMIEIKILLCFLSQEATSFEKALYIPTSRFVDIIGLKKSKYAGNNMNHYFQVLKEKEILIKISPLDVPGKKKIHGYYINKEYFNA